MWEEGDSISRTFLKYYKESPPSEEEERKGRRNPGSFSQQIFHSFIVSQSINKHLQSPFYLPSPVLGLEQ